VHAQTYSHHALGSAAALATLRYIDEHDLIARAATLGEYLLRTLKALQDGGPRAEIVGDVRGIGMLAAVELVADRAGKRPFPRERKVAERLVAHARAHGLVLWPNVGHADGVNGDLVLIAPPLTITQAEIDELAGLLARALDDVASSAFKERATTKSVARPTKSIAR